MFVPPGIFVSSGGSGPTPILMTNSATITPSVGQVYYFPYSGTVDFSWSKINIGDDFQFRFFSDTAIDFTAGTWYLGPLMRASVGGYIYITILVCSPTQQVQPQWYV